MPPAPYKVTSVFDEVSLPAAIRNAHSTKPGVWGLLRVLDGKVRLIFHEPHQVVEATPECPVPIPPEAVHHVALCGPMRMQVEFYRAPPTPPAHD
jgi:tellurite resistance-related uncharacterized protein